MNVVKAIIGVTVFAALHFVAALATLSVSFGLVMDRFERGGEATFLEKTLNTAADILWFPARQVAEAARIHNDLAEWLLAFGNSALWGFALYAAFVIVRGSHRSGMRPHFSLRTLLIVTTLVAIALGLIVWASR